MIILFQIILGLIDFYTYIIIASVVLSWLLAFGMLPIQNQIVYKINNVIERLTAPIFDAVRAVIPPIFGLDFSPVIILLALQGIKIATIKLLFSLI